MPRGQQLDPVDIDVGNRPWKGRTLYGRSQAQLSGQRETMFPCYPILPPRD